MCNESVECSAPTCDLRPLRAFLLIACFCCVVFFILPSRGHQQEVRFLSCLVFFFLLIDFETSPNSIVSSSPPEVADTALPLDKPLGPFHRIVGRSPSYPPIDPQHLQFLEDTHAHLDSLIIDEYRAERERGAELEVAPVTTLPLPKTHIIIHLPKTGTVRFVIDPMLTSLVFLSRRYNMGSPCAEE